MPSGVQPTVLKELAKALNGETVKSVANNPICTSPVESTLKLAAELGIGGTPTLINAAGDRQPEPFLLKSSKNSSIKAIKDKIMRTTALLTCLLPAVLLTGCGSLTGFSNAQTDFSCGDLTGKPSCRNISDVYAQTQKKLKTRRTFRCLRPSQPKRRSWNLSNRILSRTESKRLRAQLPPLLPKKPCSRQNGKQPQRSVPSPARTLP